MNLTVPTLRPRVTLATRASCRMSRSLPCLALCMGMLAGCGSPATRDSPNEPPAPVITDARLDGSIRGDTNDPQLAQLWSAAQQARLDGDDQEALDLLAEGLEINPQNGLFWSRAAQIQLENATPGQAEKYAMKSNEFADGNSALLLRNWLIIRHARNARGDLLGVRMAEKRVQQYQQE